MILLPRYLKFADAGKPARFPAHLFRTKLNYESKPTSSRLFIPLYSGQKTTCGLHSHNYRWLYLNHMRHALRYFLQFDLDRHEPFRSVGRKWPLHAGYQYRRIASLPQSLYLVRIFHFTPRGIHPHPFPSHTHTQTSSQGMTSSMLNCTFVAYS